MSFDHLSVLLNEVCDAAPEAPLRILDCTLGAGGHSLQLLERFPECHLTGLDQDSQAIHAASKRLHAYQDRCDLQHTDFASYLQEALHLKKFDYILADLGVSSPQLDHAERGFSFMKEGPLDMRMNPDQNPITAFDIVNTWEQSELRKIFKVYGEEPFAALIAKNIVEARLEEPFATTQQLAEAIKAWIPKKRQRPGFHAATLSFQALRIVVNQELEQLEQLLHHSIKHLNPNGRLAVISFHSLEDRRIKQQFKKWASPCTCPPQFPYCICNAISLGAALTRKAIIPSAEEQKRNPRSRSAKLRVFEHQVAIPEGEGL